MSESSLKMYLVVDTPEHFQKKSEGLFGNSQIVLSVTSLVFKSIRTILFGSELEIIVVPL